MGVDTYVGFEATTQFLTLSTYSKLELFFSSFYSTELLSVLHEDSLFSSNPDAVDSHDVELNLRNTAEPSTRLVTTSTTSTEDSFLSSLFTPIIILVIIYFYRVAQVDIVVEFSLEKLGKPFLNLSKLIFGGPSVNVAHGHIKIHEDTDRQTIDLKPARLNYPNSTMQPFVLQNALVCFQYPKPALSYKVIYFEG